MATLTFHVITKEKESKSTTVKFLKQDGSLIHKEFYPAVGIGGVQFQVVILTDVVTGEKIGCLRLTTLYYSTNKSDTYTGILDSDELAACIQSLKYIKNTLCTSTSNNHEECAYRSRDGVILGAYHRDNKTKWEAYVQTQSYTTHSMKTINVEELHKVISTMEYAQNTIMKALNGHVDDNVQSANQQAAPAINPTGVLVEVTEKTAANIQVKITNNATQTLHYVKLRVRYLINGSLKRIQMAEEVVEVNPNDQKTIVIPRGDTEKSNNIEVEVQVMSVE